MGAGSPGAGVEGEGREVLGGRRRSSRGGGEREESDGSHACQSRDPSHSRVSKKENGGGDEDISMGTGWFINILPCCFSHVACQLSRNGKYITHSLLYRGKCVGSRLNLANGGVSFVRMAIS